MAELAKYMDEEQEGEDYDENADDDFTPDGGDGDGEGSSSEEEEEGFSAKASKKAAKRKGDGAEELDSGDEATIQEQRAKRRRKHAEQDGEESAGEGSFIRTRAQRTAEKAEGKGRKRAGVGEVTIDVNAIWEELKNAPMGRGAPPATATTQDAQHQTKENAPVSDDFVTISRRIKYAGEVTEVTEIVPRSSKEAQAYLRDHPDAHPSHKASTRPTAEERTLLRPLKRPSLFEPNPTAIVKGVPADKLRLRAPSRVDVLMAEKRAEEEQKKKAERMTTVQKSALDWKGFVDMDEGLKGELEEYGKSRGTFLGREEFLGRAEVLRQEQARAARLKG